MKGQKDVFHVYSLGKNIAKTYFMCIVLVKALQTVFNIMITYPCNLSPLLPHFYILENWGLQGYTFFRIFGQKHRLWVHVITASMKLF